MSASQLMEYFKFDTEDLYANQNGRFTEKQRVHLTQLDKSRRRTSLGVGILLVAVGAIGPVIVLISALTGAGLGFLIGFGIGFGLIWPVVWGGIGYLLIKGAREKREFKVASVQGRANIVARESRTTDSDGHTSTRIYHELHVGGVTFGVNRNLADIIFQGDEYIIYYVPATKDIISVEEVRKSK